MTLADKLFSFEGRLRRQDWWLLMIALSIVGLVISEALVLTLVGPQAGMFGGDAVGMMEPKATLIRLLISIPFWWPHLALGVKRRHDRDKSARVYIVAFAGAILVGCAPMALSALGIDTTPIVQGVLSVIYLPVSIWMFIVVGFLDGTPGPNRFGPSPKGLGGAEPVAETFN